MSYSFVAGERDAPGPAGRAGGSVSDDEALWVDLVENRVLERVEGWLSVELDDRVLRIVEDKLREETERRAWRRGQGVF